MMMKFTVFKEINPKNCLFTAKTASWQGGAARYVLKRKVAINYCPYMKLNMIADETWYARICNTLHLTPTEYIHSGMRWDGYSHSNIKHFWCDVL